MSEEQLKAFWEAIQTDPSLQAKLRATTDADSIASIAKEAGFEISADEVKKAQSALSDEALEGIDGGYCGSGNCQASFCDQSGCICSWDDPKADALGRPR